MYLSGQNCTTKSANRWNFTMLPSRKGRNSGSSYKKLGQEESRRKLAGPLEYGEEAYKAIRSKSKIQNQNSPKQSFRFNRGGPANVPAPSGPLSGKKYFDNDQTQSPRGNGFSNPSPIPNIATSSRLNSKISPPPQETFQEFTERVNTLTANKYDLDPALHESFLELSLGQSPHSSTFDWGPDYCKRRAKGYTNSNAAVLEDKQFEHFRDTRSGAFEATFGLNQERNPGEETETTLAAQRYWKKNVAKTKGHWIHKTQQKLFLPKTQLQRQIEGNMQNQNRFKTNILKDGQAILRGATRLLEQSSKISMSEEEAPPLPEQINYIPLNLRKPRLSVQNTFLNQIEERRNQIRENGYHIEEDEPDGTGNINSINSEILASGKFSGNTEVEKGAFAGTKLSTLIAKNVAAIQGQRINITEEDEMNPLEKKMLQGIENYELSYFLNGAGQRSQSIPEQRFLRPIPRIEKNVKLTPGVGQTNLIDGTNESKSSTFRSDNKLTKYLDNLRQTGYSNLPSKAGMQARNDSLKFNQDKDKYDFDESLLEQFNLEEDKRQEMLDAMLEKRIQRIRSKASSTASSDNPAVTVLDFMMGNIPQKRS